MRWIAAPEEAAAVAASLHPDANTIAGLVPARHAAYALIFHPVTDVDGAEHRWDEIAARNGRQVHAAMTFQAIRTPTDETRDRSTPSEHAWPLSSATPIAVLDRLLEYLECSTTTPANVTFCIWTGYAGFSEDVGGWHSVDGGSSWTRMQPKPRQPLMTPEERALPTVVVRGNGYHVYVGSLSASRALLPHTPNLWWPDDHAWAVGRDIEGDATCVAGSRTLIDLLLGDPAIEVIEVSPTSHVDRFSADPINT